MKPILSKIWILFFAITLSYGCYLYISHGGATLIQKASFDQPLGQITAPFEQRLTQQLSTAHHPLLTGLARTKLALLDASISPKVEPGKAGWLFLKQEEPTRNTIEQSLGIQQYTELELKRWALLFKQREYWTEVQNMRYVLVLAPNKASVYPEFLPSHYHSQKTSTSIEKLKAKLNDIDLIDVGDHLKQNKDQGRLFQFTDTHWNDYGAFLAYQYLIQSLPAPFNDQAFELRNCRQAEIEKPAGDLARLLLMDQRWTEKNLQLKLKDTTAIFHPDRSKSIGPNLTPLIYTTPDTTRPKALFDHDSFGKYLVPFLAEHFRESAFLWGWQGFHTGLIKREKPDLVVDQFVERALVGPLPRNDWEVIQKYWEKHFDQLPPGTKGDAIQLTSMMAWANNQSKPSSAVLAVAKIEAQPNALDKLIVQYYNDRGFYWLPVEGQTYFLELGINEIHHLEAETDKTLSGVIELRWY